MRAARIRAGAACVLVGALVVPAFSEVFTYEANSAPEDFLLFERVAGHGVERSLESGWFIQTFEDGGQDFYRRNIGGINNLVDRFFMEWRAVTDNPEWLIDEWQVPAVISAAGRAGVLYHTVMTESAAVLLRDVFIPRVNVPMSVGEPHIYRVEVYGDEYIWYIDGVVMDSGVPEGPYPDPEAFVIWGAEVTFQGGAPPATTAWDYVRFGEIPEDGSGDYDSDDEVARDDYRFFVDCLTKDGPGIFGGPDQNAGPGCRFADFNGNDSVDLFDFAEFQNAFDGPV